QGRLSLPGARITLPAGRTRRLIVHDQSVPLAGARRSPESDALLAEVVLLVARLPLVQLAPLLRFDAEGGDRPRLQAAQPDLLARLLAVSVRSVVYALQREIDLLQQLPLAIPCSKLEIELRFLAGTVVQV